MPDPVMQFYTAEKLGAKQSLTPEGFLLCLDVPIARCGTMLYSQGEVPVEADRDGLIRIMRDPEDVFAPGAIASFNGKPICNDHPPQSVDPSSWKTYTIGTVLNPRQGDGLIYDNEYLYADLLVQDRDAIKDVREGKREVSAGYTAEYSQESPGVGRQHLIVGNHVALVDRGRCGPRCAIGDSAMSRRRVSDAVLAGAIDRIRRAYTARDESSLVDELDRVSTMLGDILAGANESGGFANVDAPVKGYGGGTEDARRHVRDETHIHVHAGGGDDAVVPPGGAPDAGGGTPPPAPGGGADPAAAGGDPMQQIMQRLEAVERAIAILAQEGGDDGNAEEDPNGDPSADPGGDDPSKDKARGMRDARRRTRDDEPSAPPTEEPDGAEGKENVALDRARRRMVGDNRAMVGDSTSMAAQWRELLSRAEILAPGVRLGMTFDARRPAKATFDAMCQFRRKALTEALEEDDTRDIVRSMAGNQKLAQMTCDAVSILFNGASEQARQANSGRTAAVGDGRDYHARVNGVMQSQVSDINKRNKEFYKVQH